MHVYIILSTIVVSSLNEPDNSKVVGLCTEDALCSLFLIFKLAAECSVEIIFKIVTVLLESINLGGRDCMYVVPIKSAKTSWISTVL